MQKTLWDSKLIKKYNIPGPRYTSYPTAVCFQQSFQQEDYIVAHQAATSNDLALYIHIPFCHQLCYYCACNKLVTRHQNKADDYLQFLELEIQERAKLLSVKTVKQLHLGGGTPNFLTENQIKHLMQMLHKYFNFSPDAQLSIEIDPHLIDLNYITLLHELGFNRVSLGVQDFNPEVQEAVNRVRDESFILEVRNHCQQLGIDSLNMDLIYGLPYQTTASFEDTLDKLITMKPNRVSLFNYAHMPQLFSAQRKLEKYNLPNAQEKLAILQMSIEKLTQAGYVFIGMDHFALPTDELAIAQKNNQLHRNFQGYTTEGHLNLIALGVSAISTVGSSYFQNHKDLNSYYQSLQENKLPLWRGAKLTEDDKLRAYVIKQLICNFTLAFDQVENQFNINFQQYFKTELENLAPLIEDGLLTLNDERIQVLPIGRLLIRNICMCFDFYLQQKKATHFSKAI